MKRKFTKYPSTINASRESEYYAKKAKEEAEENERVSSNLEIAQKYAPILSREGYDGEYFVTWVEEEHYYDDLRDPDDLRGVIWNFVLGYICERDDYGGSEQEAEADEVTNKILSEVNACDKVTASSRYEPDDSGIESYQEQLQSKKNNVLCIRDSKGNIKKYKFHSIDGQGDVFEPETGSGNWWTSYIVTPDKKLLMWEFSGRYTPVDATYGEDFWVETANEENIESATDTKYFANMVSASIDDGDYEDEFLVEGYYDNQRRGLAESAETSDVSALNELINDYANKGYYIVVHNLIDGTITEFSADNWFDDLARDGGAILFMS